MRATIDKAGRLVMPKPLRDRLGLRSGEVDVLADGDAIRVEPIVGEGLEEEGDWLVIPASGLTIDDADVPTLRDADQK